MKVHDLFRHATGRLVCMAHDNCRDCHAIYGLPDDATFCPRELTDKQVDEAVDFIQRVDKLLRQKEVEEVFDWEMTDEEFVNMLMEMADND